MCKRPLLTFCPSYSGGEEVLLDVGGQDATEAFEDVGHSDEARETLEALKVGTLKRKVSFYHTFPLSYLVTGSCTGFAIQALSEGERWKSAPCTNNLSQQQAGDPTPKASLPGAIAPKQAEGAGLGIGLYAIVLIGGALAYGAYQYLQQQQAKQVAL